MKGQARRLALAAYPFPYPGGHPFAYLGRGVELELDYRDISFHAMRRSRCRIPLSYYSMAGL